MTTKQQTAEQNEKAIASLRETFPAGSTVYVSIKHVSRSGMQRAIAVYGVEHGEIVNLSWQVARALGWHLHPRYDGVKVNGCGMDMGYHLVHSLSRVLHDNGYTLGHRQI